MSIAIDANMVIGVVIPHQITSLITEFFRFWQDSDEQLIAPYLLEYEVTSALRKAAVIGMISRSGAEKALQDIFKLGIKLIEPSPELDSDALRLAERIGQAKAYDAQYLALASRENAPLWTADRRLANAANAAGLGWVRWVGDWDGNPDE